MFQDTEETIMKWGHQGTIPTKFALIWFSCLEWQIQCGKHTMNDGRTTDDRQQMMDARHMTDSK